MIRIILCLMFVFMSNLAAADDNSAVMQVFAFSDTRGTLATGTAVLTDKKNGCLTTNQHVVMYNQAGGVTLSISYKGERHDVFVKEEHQSEDLALVCFVTKPHNLPAAIRPSSFSYGWQDACSGVGFPTYTPKDKDKTILQQAIAIKVTTESIALPNILAETRKLRDTLYELKVQSPRVRVSREFISGAFTDMNDVGMIYGGISGGALLDSEGGLVGITTMSRHDGTGLLVISSKKIPRTFFE